MAGQQRRLEDNEFPLDGSNIAILHPRYALLDSLPVIEIVIEPKVNTFGWIHS
jgi:hypothetical protein